MEFEEGDVVSGRGIRLGRYVGNEVINDMSYYKIYDINSKANYYVPSDKIENLRKLPSKNNVKKHLEMFNKLQLVDDGEIEGSRYKYFKSKLKEVNFQKTLEVLHDLSSLRVSKEINSSERKLLNDLKEKMIDEIAFVLECENQELEDLIDLKKLSA